MNRRPTSDRLGPVAKWVRRIVVALLLVGICCGVPIADFVDEHRASVYEFSEQGGHYRLRLTGPAKRECAQLERHKNSSDSSRLLPWRPDGADCAWPRVTGGDGWLAGGSSRELHGRNPDRPTRSWVFFGIVPERTSEVVLTVDTGTEYRIPTRKAGGGTNRVYLHVAHDVRNTPTTVGVQLRTDQGGVLRVY